MPTVVLSKLTQRRWKDENPTVGLSNLTRRWRGTENPTVVMPYLAQRRLKNGNPTVALPTLILCWFNVVKPTPTYSRPLRSFTDVGSTSPCRLGCTFMCIYLFSCPSVPAPQLLIFHREYLFWCIVVYQS
jgi:hypothetical protein